jgi:hypothetical protein
VVGGLWGTLAGGWRYNWWEQYGRGLTNRYNEERRRFLDLSHGND